MKKPNILFVFADQMRGSALGCAGIEDVMTPNLDAFAKESTRFIRAISNTPVCSPARASILSGLHTLSHEVVYNDITMRTDIKSIAHCLNEEGYMCGYIGKWHLDCADRGVFIPPGPRRQGFDDYWAAYNCNHMYYAGYYYLNDNPKPVWIDGYEPEAQTNLAIEYIKNSKHKDGPFCLFLSWGPPHCPYEQVPEKYLDMYPPENIRLKPNATKNADKRKIAAYYAQITAIDDCFGKLMRTLNEEGLKNDTIVVFTSDHGDMLYSHNRGWKFKPWAESVNIPFIIRWPGRIPANRVSDGLISLVDVMPTLLSLVGAKIPEEVEGLDLSKLVLGDDSASPDSIFVNFPNSPKRWLSYPEWRGVITKRYTYARFRDKIWVLYDDLNDPYQLNNLAELPEYEELRKEMENELQKWLKRLNDSFESTDEVAKKYYPGSVNGFMEFYENEEIRTGIAERMKKYQQEMLKKNSPN